MSHEPGKTHAPEDNKHPSHGAHAEAPHNTIHRPAPHSKEPEHHTAKVDSKKAVADPKKPLSSSAAPSLVHDHPDAAYIKRDDLGQVIAQGMAVLYLTHPKNPVDFLAKWLLNYSHAEKQALLRLEQHDKV